ncbi:MAG: hypothetical protein OER88_01950 [Planctomycetota bacterium]|nr:hypothetical protein [Planctomycetota bacterium]
MRWAWLLPLLMATARAEEARLTFHFENENAERIVSVISVYSKLSVSLAPEYHRKSISIRATNSTVETVLEKIAKQLFAKVVKRPDGTITIVAPWRAQILGVIDKKVLYDVDWSKGLPLAEVAAYVRSVSGIGVVLDPRLDGKKKVALTTKQSSLTEFLNRIAKATETPWDLRYGVIYFAAMDRMTALPRELKDIADVQAKVKLPFDNTPMPQVVGYLKAALGIRISIAPDSKEALEAVEVTAQANVHLRNALALCTIPYGATVKWTRMGYQISTAPAAKTR